MKMTRRNKPPELKGNFFIRCKKYIVTPKNQPIVQNILGLAGLLVTLWLTIVTYNVFRLSSDQAQSVKDAGNAAKQSAIIAKQSLDLQIKFKKSDDSLQKIKTTKDDSIDKVKSTRDSNTFELQKTSLNAQIESLTKTQQQFEIENRPFFDVANLHIDTNNHLKLSGTFDIENAGRQPGQIVNAKFWTGISTNSNLINPTSFEENTGLHGVFITNTSRYQFSFHTNNDTPIYQITDVRTGKAFVYFIGEIEYRATFTRRIYVLKFDFRITVYPNLNIYTLYEN